MSRRRKQGLPRKPDAAPPDEGSSGTPAVPSQRPKNEHRWIWAICLSLAILTWLVFGQTRHFGFIDYDDKDYIYNNPIVSQGLTLDGIAWAFTHVHASNWHPLTWISHMLDCQFYGLNAGGHHVTNVLIHGATAILLFLLLRQITGFLWRSAFVAAVFAIHPLRVESVAWVAERKDVLCGLFFVLTLWAYAGYARRPFSLGRYGLVALLLSLGLMSKPMLVTLPIVLLLADYWPLGLMFKNGSFDRRRLLDKIPLLGLAAASCAATLFAQTDAMQKSPFFFKIGNAALAYVIYIGQMFWPVNLIPIYPIYPQKISIAAIVFSLVLLPIISAGVFVLRRRGPYLVTGWLWFLIMLVPVIGIVQVGSQSHADRYTYLPQIGLYLMLAWGVGDLCLKWRGHRWFLGGLSVAAVLTLAFLSRAQTTYWRNDETLWMHTLDCTPDNPVANVGMGVELVDKGKFDEAETYTQKAIEVYPSWWVPYDNLGTILIRKSKWKEAIPFFQKSLELNSNQAAVECKLASTFVHEKRFDEAAEHFQAALKIAPDHAGALTGMGNVLGYQNKLDEAIGYLRKALAIDPSNMEAHFHLGRALYLKGQLDEAIEHLQKASEGPSPEGAYGFLGMALFEKGQTDKAVELFKKSLKVFPDDMQANFGLARVLARRGQVEEAIEHYQKVLKIEPTHVTTMNNLAWILATSPQARLRNGPKALELATRADQLIGKKDPIILDTLAAAYAEVGQFSKAADTARQALELANAQSNAAFSHSIEERVACYQAGSAFHETPASK